MQFSSTHRIIYQYDKGVGFKAEMNNSLFIKLNIINNIIPSNFFIAKIFYLMWFVAIF